MIIKTAVIFFCGIIFYVSPLFSAECVQWNTVKNDIVSDFFNKNPKNKMISIDKGGESKIETRTGETGKMLCCKNGEKYKETIVETVCVQKATVVYEDDTKTRSTSKFSVYYSSNKGKQRYLQYQIDGTQFDLPESRLLPQDNEFKKIIIGEWNKKATSKNSKEILKIKDFKIKPSYSYSPGWIQWIVLLDMTVIYKGGIFSGDQECTVSGLMIKFIKKSDTESWDVDIVNNEFRTCD